MASKKTIEAFNKKVLNIIQEFGAEQIKDNTWSLKTKAGTLKITFASLDVSKVFSIFCVFENGRGAIECVSDRGENNLNAHSGKWNFHDTDSKELLREFKAELTHVVYGNYYALQPHVKNGKLPQVLKVEFETYLRVAETDQFVYYLSADDVIMYNKVDLSYANGGISAEHALWEDLEANKHTYISKGMKYNLAEHLKELTDESNKD